MARIRAYARSPAWRTCYGQRPNVRRADNESMIRLRLSKLGLTLGVTFLLIAATLFAIHLHSATTSAGDPGDAGLLFFLVTLPWAYMLPEWVVGESWWADASYYGSWLFVGFNAFLLYCLAGGLGLRRSGVTNRRAPRRDRRLDPHAARDG